MLCAQLGWPWPSGSLEKKISIKFCWCIFTTLYFVIILLWKKGALQLNKPESLSHKDTLCHIWMVLEKIFKILSMFYFWLFFLTHCGKWHQSFSFDWTWYPFTQGCFVQSLVEIGPVVLEKKIFKCRQCIFKFLLSPIEKWCDFHLKTVEIPFLIGYFVQNLS